MRLASVAVFTIACSSPSRTAPVVANQASASPAPSPIARTRGLEFRVVEDNSAFMERLFVHVGLDSAGKPTDPLALSVGVATEIDMWLDPIDSNKRHRDYYLVGKERAILESYVAQLAAKDPSFDIPKDRELGFERIDRDHDSNRWRTYLLERTVSLDGSMVANAVQAFDPNTGAPVVLLDFDEKGAKALTVLTKRIVGKKLAIMFEGRVRSAPIINGEIVGGRASIAMGGNIATQQQRDAEQLVQALTRK